MLKNNKNAAAASEAAAATENEAAAIIAAAEAKAAEIIAAAEAKAAAAKPAPRLRKATIAGIFDAVMLIGGDWQQLLEIATAERDRLQIPGKMNKSLLMAHARYRKFTEGKIWAAALALTPNGCYPTAAEQQQQNEAADSAAA